MPGRRPRVLPPACPPALRLVTRSYPGATRPSCARSAKGSHCALGREGAACVTRGRCHRHARRPADLAEG